MEKCDNTPFYEKSESPYKGVGGGGGGGEGGSNNAGFSHLRKIKQCVQNREIRD